MKHNKKITILCNDLSRAYLLNLNLQNEYKKLIYQLGRWIRICHIGFDTFIEDALTT